MHKNLLIHSGPALQAMTDITMRTHIQQKNLSDRLPYQSSHHEVFILEDLYRKQSEK